MDTLRTIESMKHEMQSLLDEMRTIRVQYENMKKELESMTYQKYSVVLNYEDDIIVDRIINAVCEVTDVSREQFLSSSRLRKLVIPRQIASYLIDKYTSNSLTAIGRIISSGKPKNHATIIYSIKQVENDYWAKEKYGASTDTYKMCERAADMVISQEEVL